MKINVSSSSVGERSGTIKQGGVHIAQNIQRESVMLNKDGDVIDPRTKQIIQRKKN